MHANKQLVKRPWNKVTIFFHVYMISFYSETIETYANNQKD